MCANCRHTGCWLYLGLLYLVDITANGQTVCSPGTSGSNPVMFDPDTLSMSTPEVQAMISQTGSVSHAFVVNSNIP